jgi:dTDP-L-rhamnose 4-epimerase
VERPEGLSPEVELIRGDVRDGAAVASALAGIDSVVHLAAEVGVGQSMYEVERYTFDQRRRHRRTVREADRPAGAARRHRLLESIYGEGLYRDARRRARGQDAKRQPGTSDEQSLGSGVDARGPSAHARRDAGMEAARLASIYALNKYVQERTTLIMSEAYGMEARACAVQRLRPGQALSNPYTGVLAIFASRLLNGQQPMIFEDGEQRRDFVYVGDVARAFADALYLPQAVGGTFNIGSGHDRSVTEVAQALAQAMGKNDIQPEIVGKSRIGDIRHCFCDTSLAREELGFEARQEFVAGLAELAEWVQQQTAEDRVAEARAELEARDSSRERPASPGDGRSRLHRLQHCRRIGFSGSFSPDLRLARPAGGGAQPCLVEAAARRASWRHSRRHSRPATSLSAPSVKPEPCSTWPPKSQVTTSLEDPRDDFEVNIGGTFNLLEAVRLKGSRTPLVFASTNKVYGDLAALTFELGSNGYAPTDPAIRAHGISEAWPLDFHTPYGCSKGAADQYVLDYARSFGVPATVLRMSCIYGQRQMGTEDQGWVAHFLIRALKGEQITLYGDGLQVRDILDVSNAVEAYLAAWRHIDRAAGQPSTSAAARQMRSACAHCLPKSAA